MKRETGLDLPADHFAGLCATSLLWQRRKQVPEDNGTADIALAFVVRVTPAERAAIRWDDREYDAVKWVAPEALARSEEYHPALRRAATHVLARRQLGALEDAVKSGAPDADVAAAARKFMTLQEEAAGLAALPVPFSDIAPRPNGDL